MDRKSPPNNITGPCRQPGLLLALPALLLVWLSIPLAGQDGIAADVREHAVVLDDQRRPITAGGFISGAPKIFADITEETGLGAFQRSIPEEGIRYIIETKSGALAMVDFNRDGWLDLYVVSGSVFPALLGKAKHLSSALFRNNGDGTFTNVTPKARVPNHQWGLGVVSGDFNNDGWPDLYVSNFGPNRLYRNNGDDTFDDVAETAGVRLAEYMTTGASFGDYNRDGFLDLFVCGYAEFDPKSPPKPGKDIPVRYCRYRGDNVMCGPRGLTGTRDFLFRNNGDGTFTEVAREAGVEDRAGYYGFSPAFVDVNDDGWVDLVVANDSTPNYLYLNRQDGTFEDVSFVSGFALNQDAREQASMGLGIGDYNLDGLIDFYTTHFSNDYNTLYQNQGDTFFIDVSYEAGLADVTLPFVGWGTGFLDYDNDGYQDLFLANGHAYPGVDKHNWGTTWAQRPLLFRNVDGKGFAQVPAKPDSGLSVIVVGRGAAFGDLDNDGRIDVALNCLGSSPKVLRNVSASPNNWITLQLKARGKTPPGAIGATLFLKAGGKTQRRDVFSGASFTSDSDRRIHFGIGSAEKADELKIIWPNGNLQRVYALPANRFIEISENDPRFRILHQAQGWRRKP